jgi:hypothetical protein
VSPTIREIREEGFDKLSHRSGRGVILATKGTFENEGFLRELCHCEYPINQVYQKWK